MQLQNLYQRLFDRPKPAEDVSLLPRLPDDDGIQDTDALIIQPPYAEKRQKHMGYIALVGTTPGNLLKDGLLNNSTHASVEDAELRTIELPTDTRSAMGLLYELEYADLILFVLDTRQRLSSEHLRWLSRMQELRVPLVLLINNADQIKKHVLPGLIKTLEQRLNFPVVPIYSNDHPTTRQQLVHTIFRISPRLAAMLSLQSPPLRPILVEYLLTGAAFTSLGLNPEIHKDEDLSPLAEAQVRLTRQIKSVYGKGTRLSREEYQGMLTMATAVTHYTCNLVNSLPGRNRERRARLANAVSTLLVGYITMVYHGEMPPEIRSQVLPQIWRLYRASGQMANS